MPYPWVSRAYLFICRRHVPVALFEGCCLGSLRHKHSMSTEPDTPHKRQLCGQANLTQTNVLQHTEHAVRV